MIRWTAVVLTLGGLLFLGPLPPALPCTLCRGDLKNTLTLRQDAANAKLILFGPLHNPRLVRGADGQKDGAATDLKIERVLKTDPFLGDKKVIELPRYIPVDPKDPPKFLILCDVFKDKLDPYRGVPVKSEALVDYLKGALALDGRNQTDLLLYYFRYLDHPDAEVASDAFLEFAKAGDQEIGKVAPKLAVDKLRKLLADPLTPPERLSLYAFLAGACGGDKEAELLQTLMRENSDRTHDAFSGLLAGYIQLQPRKGWTLAHDILSNPKKPFPERLATIRTLEFYHGWKPEESRREVLVGLAALIPQGDLADLAIEDLRKWQIWDLTNDVLAQYGKKSHDAPIMKRTIVRYALTCPLAEAARFVAERRKQEPELVQDVEESLQFEKRK